MKWPAITSVASPADRPTLARKQLVLKVLASVRACERTSSTHSSLKQRANKKQTREWHHQGLQLTTHAHTSTVAFQRFTVCSCSAPYTSSHFYDNMLKIQRIQRLNDVLTFDSWSAPWLRILSITVFGSSLSFSVSILLDTTNNDSAHERTTKLNACTPQFNFRAAE